MKAKGIKYIPPTPTHEVLMRCENDDDTVALFAGTWNECCIYTQAYIDSTLTHSSYYYLNEHGIHTPQEYDHILHFRSPLVSVDNFDLWIDTAKPA